MASPVTLEDARRQVRLEPDDTSMDVELAGFISDAAAWVERYTGHILIARDVTEAVFADAGLVAVRAWPVQPLATPVVTANDIPIDGCRLDLSGRPARIRPATGAVWPTSSVGYPLQITIRAGYEDEDPVPGNFRRAMLLLIGAYDADREGGEIFMAAEKSARSLCSDYRLRRV